MLSRGRYGLDTWTTIPGVQSVFLRPAQGKAHDTQRRRHDPQRALSVSKIYPMYEALYDGLHGGAAPHAFYSALSHPSSPCRPRFVSRE